MAANDGDRTERSVAGTAGSSLHDCNAAAGRAQSGGDEAAAGPPARLQSFAIDLGEGVRLEMVAIPGGSYAMGSPAGDTGSADSEHPQHDVTVPPFFLGKYPVTQAQWLAIARRRPVRFALELDPSEFSGFEDCPVERVAWEEAVEFCTRLARDFGSAYRLPSEAEWEYACRAGSSARFAGGNVLAEWRANCEDHYGGPTPVGMFPANAFGLHDLHGNVWEWCRDRWHQSYEGAPTDGSAWEVGESGLRVIRGGAWNELPESCRAASRENGIPDHRYNDIGFRVACGLPTVPPQTSKV